MTDEGYQTTEVEGHRSLPSEMMDDELSEELLSHEDVGSTHLKRLDGVFEQIYLVPNSKGDRHEVSANVLGRSIVIACLGIKSIGSLSASCCESYASVCA